MKKKFRSTGFWLSLTGAVLLVVQQLGIAFNFNVNSEVINGVVTSVCGVMVMLGILIPSKEDNLSNLDNFSNDDDESKTVQNLGDETKNSAKSNQEENKK